MRLTCIVYEGEHGITEAIVKKIAPILGPARYCLTADFKNEFKDNYDFFVIGGPVENGDISQKILDFVSANVNWLSNKRVALFNTCASQVKGREQLELLKKPLGKSVVGTETVHAEAGHFDLPELVEYALKVKELINKGYAPVPAEQLKTSIEIFLRSHKHCTLCTGSGKRVRGTTINYTYHEGHIYAICEGAEKFANLLLNDNICISLFDYYQDYAETEPGSSLAGLQLSGTATILNPANDEYKKMIEIRGGDYDRLMSLPFILNGLSIKLHKAEFFWPQWSKMGYGSKQTYTF